MVWTQNGDYLLMAAGANAVTGQLIVARFQRGGLTVVRKVRVCARVVCVRVCARVLCVRACAAPAVLRAHVRHTTRRGRSQRTAPISTLSTCTPAAGTLRRAVRASHRRCSALLTQQAHSRWRWRTGWWRWARQTPCPAYGSWRSWCASAPFRSLSERAAPCRLCCAVQAVLRCAVLRRAVLCCAVLRRAVIRCAVSHAHTHASLTAPPRASQRPSPLRVVQLRRNHAGQWRREQVPRPGALLACRRRLSRGAAGYLRDGGRQVDVASGMRTAHVEVPVLISALAFHPSEPLLAFAGEDRERYEDGALYTLSTR